jgi:hypothetical protein
VCVSGVTEYFVTQLQLTTGHKVVISVSCVFNVVFSIEPFVLFVAQRRLLVSILRVGTTNM